MKTMMILVAMAITCCAIETTYAASRAESNAEMKRKLAALAPNHARLGGLLVKKGKGRFAFITKQNTYSKDDLKQYVEMFSGQLQFPIDLYESEDKISVANALAIRKRMDADVAIFLVSDELLPMSLVALEEKWAMINLNKIIEPGCGKKINDKRLQREFSRTFKALFSAVEIKRGRFAVSQASDLDKITADPIDAQTLFSVINGMHSYGLVAPRTVPYRRACKEGWAPLPTNEVQKAIWDEVHSLPSEPIKIKKNK